MTVVRLQGFYVNMEDEIVKVPISEIVNQNAENLGILEKVGDTGKINVKINMDIPQWAISLNNAGATVEKIDGKTSIRLENASSSDYEKFMSSDVIFNLGACKSPFYEENHKHFVVDVKLQEDDSYEMIDNHYEFYSDPWY
ncbi:hypothetical protein [Wolbachia endosymbiont of Pentidionis agamae]|uniref:hypothetical protein n=1 Tax=Wolbachia endosymbiont of Pentidionis agamae TaxID=3110435 RepID=UPI002FD673DC